MILYFLLIKCKISVLSWVKYNAQITHMIKSYQKEGSKLEVNGKISKKTSGVQDWTKFL